MKSVPSAVADGSRRRKHKSAPSGSQGGSSRVKVIKKLDPRNSEAIEAEIAMAEQRLKELSEEMSQPNVARDSKRLIKLSNEYRDTEIKLRQLYQEWEMLSEPTRA